jgi:hypothetical protein
MRSALGGVLAKRRKPIGRPISTQNHLVQNRVHATSRSCKKDSSTAAKSSGLSSFHLQEFRFPAYRTNDIVNNSRSSTKQHRERWPKDLADEQGAIEPVSQSQSAAFRCIAEEVTGILDYQQGKCFRCQIIRRKLVHRKEPDLAASDRAMLIPQNRAHVIRSESSSYLKCVCTVRHEVNVPSLACPLVNQARALSLH